MSRRPGQRVVDGRDGGKERRRRVLYGSHHCVDVEPREQHDARPDRDREGQAQREAVGVKEREHGVEGFGAFAQTRHPRAALSRVRAQIPMAEDRGFRGSGRPARQLQQRDVIERRRCDLLRKTTGARQRLPRHQLLRGRSGRHRSTRLPRSGDGELQRKALAEWERIRHPYRHDRARPNI